jgi:hypothetical protein
MAETAVKIEKRAVPGLRHVYMIDWHDDGILHEIAVVMDAPDGSVYGIEVNKLHPIDKARLKKYITSVHSDKYPLWELLSQGRLGNGMSALDFFHTNYVKVKRPRGAVIGGGLAGVQVYGEERQIGTEFTHGDQGTIASDAPSSFA